jgi:hypothetical protein
VCVTDWEESARGSPFYDLAYLSDGFDPLRLDALIDAYQQEIARAGLPLRDRDDALRLIRCFYVHRNLKTLTKAQGPGFSRDGIERLIHRIESLTGRLLATAP